MASSRVARRAAWSWAPFSASARAARCATITRPAARCSRRRSDRRSSSSASREPAAAPPGRGRPPGRGGRSTARGWRAGARRGGAAALAERSPLAAHRRRDGRAPRRHPGASSLGFIRRAPASAVPPQNRMTLSWTTASWATAEPRTPDRVTPVRTGRPLHRVAAGAGSCWEIAVPGPPGPLHRHSATSVYGSCNSCC